jgi:hypothetical protein
MMAYTSCQSDGRFDDDQPMMGRIVFRLRADDGPPKVGCLGLYQIGTIYQ